MKKVLTFAVLTGVHFTLMANPINFDFNEFRDSPFTPIIHVDTGYNDNLTREASSQAAIDSTFVKVMPGIVYTYKPSASRFSILYTIDAGHYFSSSEDNYTDHYLETNNLFSFNARNNLSLIYSYHSTHEERGTELSEGVLASLNLEEPVSYDIHDVAAGYTYGSTNASGQIKVGIGYQNKSYNNFRLYTSGNSEFGSQFSDYSANLYSAAFIYRVRASTKMVFSLERNDKQYQYAHSSNPSRDNVNDYYSIGALWDISEKTYGELSVGLQNKDFSSKNRSDFTGLSWKVKTGWLPQRHTKLSLIASLSAEDPDQFGDYVNETIANLSWKQGWFERFSTTILMGWENDDFTASNQAGSRVDDTYLYKLDMNYQFSHIINFGVYLSSEDKDSNRDIYRYKQRLIGLYTKIEL
ncbi:outer membrane beta-barrel protein [Vibrio amylolyticus]|uniref:outer membrane beta-barrel protein n=1 Tax=Vibrio amylolyticus TaxID=2847292 RepID=UPI00354B2468